ncbi:MAG: hypothetical protein WCI72_00170 [archaeon]
MVVISERSVKRIIEDVASKVERLTGWDPQLDTLSVKLVDRDQLWEHATKPRYERLGIDTGADTPAGKKARLITKHVMSYFILGQYEMTTDTLLIIPANLGFGTNESGLATILGHELTHRCQFKCNPKFARLYPSLVKKVTGSKAFEEDPQEDESYMKYLQAYMTLVEGDATHVQDQLKKMFFQDAESKSASASEFLGLIPILYNMRDTGAVDSASRGGCGGLGQKMKQYSEGKKIVGRIYEREGREAVNQLYNLSIKQLLSRFGEDSPFENLFRSLKFKVREADGNDFG